ncbi:hypothetical protein BCR42DRAFT_411686 [Absidia repens]|uniref:Uncharacterized protein n=1 Tax=Absidia repens TaxID=90262 RepID=A0A1X2IM38_9FUNG|nr:hypothetical protein BCR42DRAFT_411686 [Absidia repens]
MYRTEPHPDPYANQYPPPPPLAPEHHSSNINTGQHAYTPPVPQTMYPPEAPHSFPTNRQEITEAGHYGGYQQPLPPPPPPSVPITNDPRGHYGHAVDPQAVTMDEYRQAEQNELQYNNHGRQQQQPQHESYYMDYHDEPDMTTSQTPMVSPPPSFLHNKQPPSSQQTIQPEDIESYKPAPVPATQQHHQKNNNNNKNNKFLPAGPMMAPEDEQEAYRPKYYERDDDRRGRGSGCNCCCYNPAMTCCSCFCFLISLGFLAAGIALMIAAKVIGDKCNNQCGDMVDKAASYDVNVQPCDAICGKVVHDGMFYGGIAVAALAAIAAIWKIFMWMCAAGSRR